MNVARLRDYMLRSSILVAGELVVSLINGGRSNLTYLVSDETSRWVVRRAPTAGLTPSAHDMVREWKVTSALQLSEVPVPSTVALCEDPSVLGASFTIVDYVVGRVVRDRADLEQLSDDEVERSTKALVRTLVDLHAVDIREAGLQNFGRSKGFLERQVSLWRRQWDQVKTRELPDVERLHEKLVNQLPKTSEAAVIHGDYRIDNTILDYDDAGVIRAVVDWELSTVGDPLTDAALMCVYRQSAFDQILGQSAAWTSGRLPSADGLAEEYARLSNRDLADWPFYLALANFKLGVIGEGITHRSRSGFSAGASADGAAEVTPDFMAAGLRALAGRKPAAF